MESIQIKNLNLEENETIDLINKLKSSLNNVEISIIKPKKHAFFNSLDYIPNLIEIICSNPYISNIACSIIASIIYDKISSTIKRKDSRYLVKEYKLLKILRLNELKFVITTNDLNEEQLDKLNTFCFNNQDKHGYVIYSETKEDWELINHIEFMQIQKSCLIKEYYVS